MRLLLTALVVVLLAGVGNAAAGGMQLTAVWSVSNADAPNRLVTVTARTGSGAICWLSDSVSAVYLRRTAAKTGRATWRWRPSLWANGPDTVKINCTKGRVRRSTETFLLLGSLDQIGVIRDYAVHLVYWAPAGDMPVEVAPAASQLEADVKASLDAGATDNPFSIPRAYGDSLGAGDPRIASIDAADDLDPYPTPAKGYCPSRAQCLSPANVDAEVTRLARQHGWPSGNRTLTILFTAPSVAACFTFPNQSCSTLNEPCGYHRLNSGGYAYGVVIMSSHCNSQGSTADFVDVVVEHEQNEAVVDPFGSGIEVGDPCDANLESVPINGHQYNVQALLANGKCAFGYSG